LTKLYQVLVAYKKLLAEEKEACLESKKFGDVADRVNSLKFCGQIKSFVPPPPEVIAAKKKEAQEAAREKEKEKETEKVKPKAKEEQKESPRRRRGTGTESTSEEDKLRKEMDAMKVFYEA